MSSNISYLLDPDLTVEQSEKVALINETDLAEMDAALFQNCKKASNV